LKPHCNHGKSTNFQLSTLEKGRIIEMHNAGRSYAVIGREFKRSGQAIKNVIDKFTMTGSSDRIKGSGKPQLLSHTDMKAIVLALKRDRKISCHQIKQDLGLQNVSDMTISRAIDLF
jgi:transposase